MEQQEDRPRRKRFIWIFAVLAVIFGAVGFWITREAPTPFGFLNKYEVAEQRTSKDGKLRILVLKADPLEIWKSIQTQFTGQSVYTSTGFMNINGQGTSYRAMATTDGIIKVSDD